MSLIAISGSQGSGKTTILNELQKLGYKTITRKSARSILDEWQVTLPQVNADEELTKRFQEEITKRKFDDEHHAIKSKDVWFTERSHVDLFTYALITLGKNNAHSSWVDSYYGMCKQYNDNYHSIFYLTAGHFSPAHDGVRGSNQHYSTMVDATMIKFLKEMTQFDGGDYGLGSIDDTLQIVDVDTVEDRIFMIRMAVFGSIYPADMNLAQYLESK